MALKCGFAASPRRLAALCPRGARQRDWRAGRHPQLDVTRPAQACVRVGITARTLAEGQRREGQSRVSPSKGLSAQRIRAARHNGSPSRSCTVADVARVNAASAARSAIVCVQILSMRPGYPVDRRGNPESAGHEPRSSRSGARVRGAGAGRFPPRRSLHRRWSPQTGGPVCSRRALAPRSARREHKFLASELAASRFGGFAANTAG